MAACEVCKKRFFLRGLNRRMAVPEYRSVIGFWPWVRLRVCDACLERHDRNFRERLALLAPDVIENDEPVVQRVCLSCGTVDEDGPWREASKWVDVHGQAVRRCRFFLCGRHADLPYADGIIIASNLTGERQMKAVMEELPVVTGDLIQRSEKWRLADDAGPPGASGFIPHQRQPEVLAEAMKFWLAVPEGIEARAAWMGPIRKDYRMRYRLDLVRDYAAGRHETFSILRTGPDEFATWRAMTLR